ncbi:MAG: hypothetical protein GY754_30555, partial [bacterium]|nr:hypothetical protein [bacterium]
MRIRTQNLFIILFGALFCMLTVTGFAFSPPPPSVDPPGTVIDDPCYPGSALDSIPSFTQPADEGWNRWQTGALIVTQGSP